MYHMYSNSPSLVVSRWVIEVMTLDETGMTTNYIELSISYLQSMAVARSYVGLSLNEAVRIEASISNKRMP